MVSQLPAARFAATSSVRSSSTRRPSMRRATMSVIENLESRQMMSATLGSIAGTVYQDMRGEGLTKDDRGMPGIVVNLHNDVNGNGRIDAEDGSAIKTSKTNSKGDFKFSRVEFGMYIVTSPLPTNAVRTEPVLFQSSNPVTLSKADKNAKDVDFANYIKTFDRKALTNIQYIVNDQIVDKLEKNVPQGATVTVKFTLTKTQTISLASYISTNQYGPPLDKQVLYDYQSATLKAGTYCFTVKVPDCYFQVDFVGGHVIKQFGPDGSHISYSAQGRMISSDKGGNRACTDCTPVYDDKCEKDKKDKKDKCEKDKKGDKKDKCDDRNDDKKKSGWDRDRDDRCFDNKVSKILVLIKNGFKKFC